MYKTSISNSRGSNREYYTCVPREIYQNRGNDYGLQRCSKIPFIRYRCRNKKKHENLFTKVHVLFACLSLKYYFTFLWHFCPRNITSFLIPLVGYQDDSYKFLVNINTFLRGQNIDIKIFLHM